MSIFLKIHTNNIKCAVRRKTAEILRWYLQIITTAGVEIQNWAFKYYHSHFI
jgi:hypothetical protein